MLFLVAIILLTTPFLIATATDAFTEGKFHGRQLQRNALPRTNLLFIIFDDLRTELSIYGRKHMITPNFERLAAKSVVFDHTYNQVAVCNPSRDSLLTGLRPDTTGTYTFQTSYRPHLILPNQLVLSDYNTAGYGKILHWDGADPEVWNYDSWENGWYEYQNKEREFMNSSTMPDKIRSEEEFRDYEYTSHAIEGLKRISKESKYFMLAMGFKLPHLAVHVPYKYYEMYKDKGESWRLSKKELRYPYTTPAPGYRCCAEQTFRYMNEEGALPSIKEVNIGEMSMVFTEKMHDELMAGYCGAITFVDKQLGRILDTVDELDLWKNLTIVLTADHGMHNGEKGLWEKWTLFDESTRVPLLIHHPLSPFQGKHYPYPVELLDVYPTLRDILNVPFDEKKVCVGETICHDLQGKSLAPIVLGDNWVPPQRTLKSRYASQVIGKTDNGLPLLDRDYAITQMWRCALKSDVQEELEKMRTLAPSQKITRKSIWIDCDRSSNTTDEVSIMGYSMRTPNFRYTMWIHFNRVKMVPVFDAPPFAEELYDHRGETFANYTHLEVQNLAHRPGIEPVLSKHRLRLIDIIKKTFVFRGPFEQ